MIRATPGKTAQVALTVTRDRQRPPEAIARRRAAPAGRRSARLCSLDAMRGLTIAGMVLVNVEGDPRHSPAALQHAAWNGWTLADLVFPAFLFISGAGMAYALGRYEATHGDAAVHLRLVRRAGVLFLLGVGLNAALAPLAPLRVMGVLQRIALATLLAGLVVLHLRPRAQWLLGGGILAGYWALLALVPVPGAGGPALTPDANLPGVVDRALIGAAHMYSPAYDPEGLLGTLPAAVTVLAGFWAARWLRPRTGSARATTLLVAAGTLVLALGLAWGLVLPVNKRMWTGSFVVLSAGAALVLLGALHQAVDVRGWLHRGWALRILGRNAVLVYVASEVLGAIVRAVHLPSAAGDPPVRIWLTRSVLAPLVGPELASVGFALGLVALLWLGAWRLWRRRVFVTV